MNENGTNQITVTPPPASMTEEELRERMDRMLFATEQNADDALLAARRFGVADDSAVYIGNQIAWLAAELRAFRFHTMYADEDKANGSDVKVPT